MDLSSATSIASAYSLQIAPLSPDLARALFVTWVGMTVVFSVLIVLTLVMLALGRIFRPGPGEE